MKKLGHRSKKKNESGQTIIEYILLIAVILGTLALVTQFLEENGYYFNNIVQPVVSYLRYNYKYGDENALGWDEPEGPRQHIQISEPNNAQNFRIFVPTE